MNIKLGKYTILQNLKRLLKMYYTIDLIKLKNVIITGLMSETGKVCHSENWLGVGKSIRITHHFSE